MNIEDIKNFLNNELLIKKLKLNCEKPTCIKSNKNIIIEILNKNKWLQNKNELIYLIKNKHNLENLNIFCKCGNKNPFFDCKKGYQKHCTAKCAAIDKEVINKKHITNSIIANDGLNNYQRRTIKANNTKLNDIDENGLNCFQRIIIKSVNTKLNNIDENGDNGFQRAAKKSANTRLNDIDENGLNNYQRIILYRKSNIDKNGLNELQIAARKAVQTKLNDIDKNGLNCIQRGIIKQKYTNLNTIDEFGRNGYERSVYNRKHDIDENGLNSYQRSVIKRRRTCLSNIDENGLNSYQRSYIKQLISKESKYGDKYYNNPDKRSNTMLNNIDENGNNGFKQAALIANNSKLNNIDEKGNNGFQRTHITKLNNVDENGLNCYDRIRINMLNNIDSNGLNTYQRSKQKEYNTKRKNNSFNTSKPENHCYELLKSKFNDVTRNYSADNRYPFNCDFYIPSKDLFIECHFHWTHGGIPFNKDNQEHLRQLEKWRSSNSKYCNIAINVWTKRDPLKLKTFIDNKLNYKIFYTEEEFIKWFNKFV